MRVRTRRFGGRQCRTVRQHTGIDHDQLIGRARLAPEHQPAVVDLCIDREHQLRQLGFSDAPVKQRTELCKLQIVRFSHNRCEVQRTVRRDAPVRRSLGDGLHTGAGTLDQRIQESIRGGRAKSPIVRALP